MFILRHDNHRLDFDRNNKEDAMKLSYAWTMMVISTFLLAGCGTKSSPDASSAIATIVSATQAAAALAPLQSPTVASKPAASATISGHVYLQAPPTPHMVVYAVDSASGLWAFSETVPTDGEAAFSIAVPPGSYQVYAFSDNNAYSGYALSGGELTPIIVVANQTVADIRVSPPSQSQCGSMYGVPASPDKRFKAVAGPSQECKATAAAQPTPDVNALRIQFAPGATSSQVKGTQSEKATRYVFSAMAGQQLAARLSTAGDAAQSGIFFSIHGQDGTILAAGQPGTVSWTGKLPATQDYTLEINSSAQAPVDYTLDLSIAAVNPDAQKSEVLPHPEDTPPGFAALYGLSRHIMLPPQFGNDASLPAVVPLVIAADNNNYDISLDYGTDCHGAGACHYGSLSGKKVASTTPESTTNFIYDSSQAQKVTLAKNLQGYFIFGACGASCDDSKMFWIYNGYQYRIGLKGGAQKDVIDLANAAINNSVH